MHVVADPCAGLHKENCVVFTELFTWNLASNKKSEQEIKRDVGDLESVKQEIGQRCSNVRWGRGVGSFVNEAVLPILFDILRNSVSHCPLTE